MTKLLNVLDQRFVGAASRQERRLDGCRVDFWLLDGWADNNDITYEWTFEYHVNGNVFIRAELPDKQKDANNHFPFFIPLRGFKRLPLGTFIEGKCDQLHEITV